MSVIELAGYHGGLQPLFSSHVAFGNAAEKLQAGELLPSSGYTQS